MRPSLIFEPNRILLLEPSTPRGAGEAFKEGHPFALLKPLYTFILIYNSIRIYISESILRAFP